jgi:glycosyltransferase involved in cell wall biosynthesis
VAAFDLALAPHVPNADGSPFFGSPTKLFEYLAAGKPVVASRLGQIAEVIEHGVNGWLVPPGDAEALAAAVTALAGDPALRERLGRAARAGAAARHGWDAHVRRILDALASEP